MQGRRARPANCATTGDLDVMPINIPVERIAIPMVQSLILAIAFSTPAHAELADGDIDPSFGIGGRTIELRDLSDFGSLVPRFRLASLPGGAVQTAFRHERDGSVVVLRLDPHGIADPSFGTNGRVEIGTCAGRGDVSIATPSDGGAVVFTGACLVKLDASGAVDSSFGEEGFVAIESGPNLMAMDCHGRVVVAGLDDTGMHAHRYNANGRSDDAFGNAGSAHLDFTIPPDAKGRPSEKTLYALTIDAQGTITAGGSYFAQVEFERGILLLRLRADGIPNTTFGNGGFVRSPTSAIASNAWVDGLLPRDDGSLVVAGPATCFDECMLFARFDAAGRPDAMFGSLLIVPGNPLQFQSFGESRRAIAGLPDGRILIGVEAWHPPFFPTRGDLTLLRFHSDGTLDTGFGESGWRSYSTEDPCATCGPVKPSESYDEMHDFVVADGKVTMLGSVFFEGSTNLADYITLTRVQMDGVFDNGFD